jgi:hypothetical protein
MTSLEGEIAAALAMALADLRVDGMRTVEPGDVFVSRGGDLVRVRMQVQAVTGDRPHLPLPTPDPPRRARQGA